MGELRRQFAQRLKYLRENRGMTQEELASVSGLSLGFIRAIEQGKNAPSFESLDAIAMALNVEVKALFDFDIRL